MNETKLEQIRDQLEFALINRLVSLERSGYGRGDQEWEDAFGNLNAVLNEFYVPPSKD